MARSAAYSFFAIPELFCLLSTHVRKSDLTQCVLVCKEWSRQFQPRFWTVLRINNRFIRSLNTVPSPATAALSRNLSHIREVRFFVVIRSHIQLLIQGLPDELNNTVTEPGSLCTNLRRIYFNLDDDARIDRCDRFDLISKPLLTLLNHNLRLTYLNVYYELLQIDGLVASLSRLRHLQHLTINSGFDPALIEEPLLFLRSCLALPDLTALHFGPGVEMHWDDGDEATVKWELQAVIHEASLVRFSERSNAKRIKRLTFPCNFDARRNPLPLLLLKSDLLDLKKLDIPGFGPDASIQEIEQVVREHCSGLKHLECSEVDVGDGLAVRAFIRGCSGLQSFAASHFNDCFDGEPLMILSEVVSSHHRTLEVVELLFKRVFSRHLQEALARCKQLKRFWARGDMYSGRFSINYWDMSQSDWVCTELEELALTLDRRHPARDLFGGQEDEDEEEGPDALHVCLDECSCAPKRAFQQIGRLGKLKMLMLATDRSHRAGGTGTDYAWDLTLSKGWLGELAGLKSLRRLELWADLWRAMGQAEVEFMHEHWPFLNDVDLRGQKSSLPVEPHWQWLLDRRPQLRLAFKEY